MIFIKVYGQFPETSEKLAFLPIKPIKMRKKPYLFANW